MSKFGSFVVGTFVGAAAGLAAGALLLDKERLAALKDKVETSDTLQDLKEKYDRGTEVVKSQLSSLQKQVDDDSELKDFDDIVIDTTADTSSESAAAEELDHADTSDAE